MGKNRANSSSGILPESRNGSEGMTANEAEMLFLNNRWSDPTELIEACSKNNIIIKEITEEYTVLEMADGTQLKLTPAFYEEYKNTQKYYNTRHSISESINGAINDVKRTMLRLRENPSDQGLYNEYKEREQITLDFINSYFGFLRSSSQVYGNVAEGIPPYKSIAYYVEEGQREPVI